MINRHLNMNNKISMKVEANEDLIVEQEKEEGRLYMETC